MSQKSSSHSRVGSIQSSNGSIGSSRSIDEADSNGLLKTITEASHESSSQSSKRNVMAQAVIENNNASEDSSRWWFWNNPSGSKQVEVTEIHPSVSQQPQEQRSWNNYFTSYKNNVVGYFYYKDTNLETTPLLNQSPPNNSNTSWYSWIWNSPSAPHDDEPYSDYTNNVELYKSAKATIESTKEFCCYAYKGSINSQFLLNDNELSVYNTPTQAQPVKYNIRKTPMTPAELQENTLQVVVSSLNPSPNRTPTVASSNSSINSHTNDELNLPVVKVNQIAPDVDENFRTITFVTKLRLLGEKLLFRYSTSENHLYKESLSKINNRKLHKVKKVVIIGVHGFLPTKFVKSMIGLTTGNSIRFIEEATKSVEYWLDSVQEPGFENMYNIDTIALEGQGTISERVAKSLALLENWAEVIKESDFLFVVGHSQGAIIAINLLAQMLTTSKFKLKKKKIGLLSMAGPINGPVKNLDTKIVTRAYSAKENEIITEYLELLKLQSPESQLLQKNINILTSKNVKITLSASINDQLVPIESALANDIYHPNVYRCIHVDTDCQLPAFIITLWRLILIARNIGHLEHGLVKEFSGRCLGALSEGGHGKIFNDRQIYATALRFALESTDLTQERDLTIKPQVSDESNSLYRIPWAIRELIEDILQTKHIESYKLVHDIIEDFQQWHPTTKPWKEVKYSLDALTDVDLDDLIV